MCWRGKIYEWGCLCLLVMGNFRIDEWYLKIIYAEMMNILYTLTNLLRIYPKKRTLFLLSIILIILSSCDKEHTKEYSVQNTLSKSVLLKFKAMSKFDSVTIATKTSTQIYKSEYFFGTVGVSDERDNDGVSDFIIKLDSVEKNVSEVSWKYEEVNKYFAKYTLLIDSTLIK